MTTYRLGDRVTWVSSSAGVAKRKTGVIVRIVPRRDCSISRLRHAGSRDHESYEVEVTEGDRKRRYWPRVSCLGIVEFAPVLIPCEWVEE